MNQNSKDQETFGSGQDIDFFQLALHAPMGIVLHQEGKIIFANNAALRMACAENTVKTSDNLLEWFHPDDAEVILNRTKTILQTQTAGAPIRIRLIQQGNTSETGIVFVESVGIPARYQGNPAIIAIFYDTTERVHAERALAQSERQFRKLYDLSNRQSRDLKLIDAINSALAPTLEPSAVGRETVEAIVRICGYELVSLYMISKAGNELLMNHQVGYDSTFNTLPIQRGVMGRVARTGVGALVRDSAADPDVVWAMENLHQEICVPIRDSGRVVGVLNVETQVGQELNHHDFDLLLGIAERVGLAFERARLHKNASSSENRFRRLFEDASVGMMMIDSEKMRILESNLAVGNLLGYHSDDLRLRPFMDLVDESSRQVLLDHQHSNLSQVGQQRLDVRMRAKNGRSLWLQLTTSRFFDSSGKPDYSLLMLNDVSNEVRAQNLERARNRVLELVAADAPLDDALEEILRMLSGEVSACALISAHSSGKHLFSEKLSKPLKQLLEKTGLPRVGSISSLDGGQVLDMANDNLSEDWGTALEREHFVIAWQNPLLSARGENLGYLVAFHKNQSQFETMDSALVGAATQLAATAIESRMAKDRLAFEASHDSLTGLPNRFMFERTLAQSISRAHRQNEQLAVLFVDLDKFKRINDTLGHEITDLLLCQVAQRLRSCVRAEDTVARFVGDEFLVLVENLGSSEGAMRVAQNILEAFNQPFRIENPNNPEVLATLNNANSDGQELFVTVSIGVCVFPNDGEDAVSLIRNSDAAMDKAKGNGRSTFVFYTPEMHVAVVERLQLENELRRAIERNQLELHYQGQFDLAGKLVGAEALVRWRHPQRGLIPPNYFIPVAEASGLMLPLGSWVLRQACRQAVRWGNTSSLWVSVNVSARQFLAADFFAQVRSALQDSGLSPERLELELTESVVMDDLELVSKRIAAIKKLGVRIAIDDFGTGYSSLGYLQRLAVDTLKIDRSFLNNLRKNSSEPESTFDSGAGLVLESIINLAHGLGLTVVVEGVEEVWQLELLSRMQVDRLQGFHFAKPVSNKEFEVLIGVLPRNPTPIV